MEGYLKITHELSEKFDKFELTRIPQGEKTLVYVLAALASTSDLVVKRFMLVEGIEIPNAQNA